MFDINHSDEADLKLLFDNAVSTYLKEDGYKSQLSVKSAQALNIIATESVGSRIFKKFSQVTETLATAGLQLTHLEALEEYGFALFVDQILAEKTPKRKQAIIVCDNMIKVSKLNTSILGFGGFFQLQGFEWENICQSCYIPTKVSEI